MTETIKMERFNPFKIFSKRDREMAERFGRSDIDHWGEYEEIDTVPSFDKGGHKERSMANQPNHKKYWKKNN